MSMDIVFHADEQEFISPIVNFKTFGEQSVYTRDKLYDTFGENGVRKLNALAEDFAVFAAIDVDSAEKIYDLIDVEQLRSPLIHYNFEIADPSESSILSTSWHRTLTILKREHEKRRNPQYKSVAMRMLKYDRIEKSLLTIPHSDKVTDCDQSLCNQVDFNSNGVTSNSVFELMNPRKSEPIDDDIDRDEMIISCSIYMGYNRPLHFHEIRLGRLMKVTDSLLLTASSTLLQLKNSFRCPSDFSFTHDMSVQHEIIKFLSLRQFPSSYFFINDTFYVDFVSENSQDISRVVREWADHRPEIGEMKVASMSDTRLIDLKARLGMPYLYVHQGQCEHLVCFTDLRIWEGRDKPLQCYPIKLNERNFRRVSCVGCKSDTAEWIVIEGDRLPMSPAFFCHQCYQMFHLTAEGEKVGNFKAIPYCDRKAMDSTGEFFLERLAQKAEKYEHTMEDDQYYNDNDDQHQYSLIQL